jgi:CRP/FNR family transcriptional regulator
MAGILSSRSDDALIHLKSWHATTLVSGVATRENAGVEGLRVPMSSRPDRKSVQEEGRPPARSAQAKDCRRCEIRHLAFCGALDPKNLDEIQGIVQTRHLDAGAHVINEGDEADAVFNIASGSIKLYKLLQDGRCQITGFLQPGDFCGIATDGTYAYSAEALEPTEICSMPRRKLEAVFARHPELERRLLAIISHELSVAQDQMLLLGRKTAAERLAAFLLRQSERNTRIGWPADPVHLAMSRADIADYLGLTIETVSRTFTKLKEEGAIRLPSKSVVELANRARLQLLAEGAGDSTH